jgi:hypothetical protein
MITGMGRVLTRRFRLRFSLRTLMIGVTLVCVVAGWFAHWIRSSILQRKAVAVIRGSGGYVTYHYELQPRTPTSAEHAFPDELAPSGPKRLRNLLGIDFFDNVSFVGGFRAHDGDTVVLRDLPALRALYVDGTKLTTIGLEPITRLDRLTRLDLVSCRFRPYEWGFLSSFVDLEELQISAPDPSLPGHEITDTLIEQVRRLPHLRRLLIANAKEVTDLVGVHI